MVERLWDVQVVSTGARVLAKGEDTATPAAAEAGAGPETKVGRTPHHQVKVQNVEMVRIHLYDQEIR